MSDRPPSISFDEMLDEADPGAGDVDWDVIVEHAIDQWSGGRYVFLPGGKKVYLTQGQRHRLAALLSSRVPATGARMLLYRRPGARRRPCAPTALS